jgi:hypothetical protein
VGLCKFDYALGGHDEVRLEEYLNVINLEAVVCEEQARGGETLFIGELIKAGM